MAGNPQIVPGYLRLRYHGTVMSKESRNRRRIELVMYADLERLYAKLPSVACRGLCHDQCTSIGMSAAEAYRVKAATGISYPWLRRSREIIHGLRQPEPCPLLKDGRCTAYQVRPFVCRIYGAVADLPCPHGCEITPGEVNDPEEVRRLHYQILGMSLVERGLEDVPVEEASPFCLPTKVTEAFGRLLSNAPKHNPDDPLT